MLYEQLYRLEKTGIDIKYLTMGGEFTPSHWHAAIEVVYILNGYGTIMTEGKNCLVKSGDLFIIDSNQIHEMKCSSASMMIILHYSRSRMKNYVPDINDYLFDHVENYTDQTNAASYETIYSLLRQLIPLYFKQPLGYELKSQSIAMDILFQLLNSFARPNKGKSLVDKNSLLERLAEITEYIDLHHTEELSLDRIASHFFLSREYFSRFFKDKMGVNYLRYLNQIRIMYIYHDICNTNKGIMELMTDHGMRNYKIFNKMFHEIYNCSPSDVRRASVAVADKKL